MAHKCSVCGEVYDPGATTNWFVTGTLHKANGKNVRVKICRDCLPIDLWMIGKPEVVE